KDKSQVFRSKGSHLSNIRGFSHATDLYFYIPYQTPAFNLFSSWINFTHASSGFFVFMKFSPMRKPLYPYEIRSTICSGVLIPLSEILVMVSGIRDASRFEVSRLTSNVFRFL